MRGLPRYGSSVLEACYIMQKMFGKWLALALLAVLFTACGGQSKDELKPVLKLTGEAQRTVTGNSVVIEGQLSDNIKVASFTYSLNGGTARDLLAALKGSAYKFTVEDLQPNKNFISLLALDTSGNTTELNLTIDVVQEPSSSEPVITIMGGDYHEISSDQIMLKGSVADDDGVVVFTYTLNDNAPVDLTNTIREDKFTLELASLKKGFNDVYFKATDTLGNTTELKVEVAAQFLATPDIAGLWGQQLIYDICGSQEMALSFTFDKPGSDGKITGLSTIINFAGETVSTLLTGYATTPETIWLEITYTNKMFVQVYLTLRNGKLEGKARVKNVSTDWCEYGFSTGSFDVSLGKNEALPSPPRDILFEPNNDHKQAKEIPATSTLSLFTPHGDRDWFKINLSEKSLVEILVEDKAHLQIARPFNTGYDSIYSFTYSEPFRRVLEAGSYYIKVSTDDCSDCVNPLNTLHITSRGLPDKNFEPNDSRQAATLIGEGFNGEFTVFVRDQDWFSFTLSETRVVTLDFENAWKISADDQLDLSYMLVKSNEQSGTLYGYYGYPVVRILSPGTYFLFLTSAYAEFQDFRLTFTSAPLIDVAYEPNDTKGEATLLTDGFSVTMFLGAGDDCDIFTFTLNQPKLITLDLGAEKFKYQVSYNDSSYWNEYSYEGAPLHEVYEAFTYYIKICDKYNFMSDSPDSRRTYPVRFTVEDVP
jgi:hypothetical protein